MSADDGTCEGLQPVLAELSAAAQVVDKDDLSGLAKMHGSCVALGAMTGPEAETADPRAFECVTGLARTLESMILGEVEDAETALHSLSESVASLIGLIGEAQAAGASEEPSKAAEAPATGPAPSAASALEAELGAEALSRLHPDVLAELQAALGVDAAAPADAEAPPQPAADDPGEQPASSPPEPSQAEPPPSVQVEVPEDDAAERYVSEPLRIDAKEIEFVKAFAEEAQEHIEAVESAVLEVEREVENVSRIDDLFRPFHTIKGMAGFLNLRDIGCLTHEAETLLDQGRKGKRAITPGLIDLILDVVDVLKEQLAGIVGFLAEPSDDVVSQPPVDGIIHKLRAVIAGRIDLSEPTQGKPTDSQRVGEILVEQGAVRQETVDAAAQAQAEGYTDKKIGKALVEEGAATARQVDQAIRTQKASGSGQQAPAKAKSAGVGGDVSVRIDTAKLDALIDMVGELVIAQTLVNANERIASDPKLAKDTGQVGKIVRDVQEVAMSMRMVPIGPTFQKMARLVRDVSRKAGKQVELQISGEDTELDKNVIQQIGDPLVHMVRNAVDHGVERADVRRHAGKSEVGHVHLSAFHHGGNIVIDISDDGKGLDPGVLIAKAIDKGVIQPGEELTEQQAFHLVFAPGFSTAAEVTDISGRGVGMDVVKRNIEALRGRVDISSEKGRGTSFSIRLPLTLAIIDGMVVRAGPERFIIQTVTIEQSLRPTPDQITTVQHKGEVLNLRGQLIPLVQLRQLFGLGSWIDPCEAMVVVGHCEGQQIGLVVEELIGQQQVVIKSLGSRFEKLKGVSGAAILGDGRVGLILDMSGLAVAHQAKRLPSIPERMSGEAFDAPDVPPEPAIESEAENCESVLP